MRQNLCIMLQIIVAHLVMMVPSRLSDNTKKRCATHYINQQNALYKIHLSSNNMSIHVRCQLLHVSAPSSGSLIATKDHKSNT